ncbi:MAG: MFS transporter, partial [Acetobacterales bacterium]
MNRLLAIALASMFGQHVVSTVGRNVPPVVAPAILADIGLPAASFGVFIAVLSFASIFFQVGCGAFMSRYGGMRMNQVSLLLLVVGLLVAVPVGFGGEAAALALFALAAVLIGGGGALATPANSHVLGRHAPPRLAPLLFSLKQTGAPLGFMAVGLAGPWLVGMFGWRGACVAFALLCAAGALA